ncbi:purine-cytosine permease family protein [Shouchella clausii]|uniref:purine-cytosine permease family protein n=1 Tax=Shouchella clausii TaxID=79880 RepID=UPI0026FBDD36|nr:cytosine permease [Shouchella clausii]MDO7267539.1 cytosine permease [Shouchella clausii]MDO7287507.1 cytosine permease [Shouchella clausii]
MENKGKVFLNDEEKTGKPKDLFFIWFAANMGILGIVYGALIIGYGLSFTQSILIAILGPLSFLLVGYASLAGRDTGAITFMLSRAAYGFKGNHIPAFIGWAGQVGWLSVNVSTGTLTLLALFSAFGISTNNLLILLSLVIFAGLIIASSFFSHDTLVAIQTFFTYVFGALTLLVIIMLIPETDWNALFSMSSGPWLTGFFPALAFVIVGTGLTWTNASADYSRFQKRSNKSSAIIGSVTLGAFIPLFVIISTGILLATAAPELAHAENPILLISEILPRWMTIIYLFAALGGLTPMCFIGLKSSRLIMSTFNIEMKESTAITVHAVIITLIPLYVLIFSKDFLSYFQTFLGILGIGLAAWVSIFIVDYIFLRRNQGYDVKLLEDAHYNPINIGGVTSWIAGVIIGLLFTIYTNSSFDMLVTFSVSGGLYFVTNVLKKKH